MKALPVQDQVPAPRGLQPSTRVRVRHDLTPSKVMPPSSYVPATEFRRAGGGRSRGRRMTIREMLQILRGFRGLDIIGGDIVYPTGVGGSRRTSPASAS